MKDEKIIIGLVGQIACGKGSIAKYLKENHGAQTFRFSTILRDILNRLNVEITRENQQKLSTFLRQTFGENLFAKVITEDVKKSEKKLVIVDGIRRLTDIENLKKLNGFTLVKITASPETRFKRLTQRNENADDTKKTYEEFLRDQKKEADAEIPAVMNEAKIEINNDGDLNILYENIEKTLKEILAKS